MSKRLITCDCVGSQAIDAEAISNATGIEVAKPCTMLCTTEISVAAAALTQGDAIICCSQESRRFVALAEELGVDPAPTFDLRDRAGWTSDTGNNVPKMSALAAEALLSAAPSKSLDVISEGLCLIIGKADVALQMAENLREHLGVTVLLEDPKDVPDTRDFDVIVGKLRRASGALGQFDVVIDALQLIEPGGRGTPNLTDPRQGGSSQCDILIDLRGETPLFPAHEKREGYLRADPSHAAAVAAATLAASHMVGTFEKPLYVTTNSLLCAHSRAEQTGCTRCLDLCPTGAIVPDGDHVTVDPMICAGCGACSAVCPSGAISYDAPPVEMIFRRIQTLAKTFTDAGGDAPRLLVVNAHGSEMISLSARHGSGLPVDVIPLEMSALNAFGHAEAIAALAAGFASVTILPGPSTDMDALNAQISLATALAGSDQISILNVTDPDAMSDALFGADVPSPIETPVRPMGTRRQITRQSARALHPNTETLALPEGAPYGAVLIDKESCTLCLSCVSLCPSGALLDNPDQPQLRFQEDACLQCGICASVCPEDAIGYEPRLNLADSALSQEVLNEEEPFACVECGELFGVKSTIEKITEKLSGHSMFSDPGKLRMIQMCDNCRINVQYHSDGNPLQGADRPKVRTSEDYFAKRRDH
ncbi:(4Fe-4S)-binding protein [Sulfitobacter sp. SK012]|uniref:4Fe-4S binding protein n=1 Tax=Sulfitobacter sp. SK012 TaxID=1389005 RepID=UPI000E0A8194|nr:4Fe-4S binding protein [Sulfitobacter sp. SK012]AXI48765.1 (4Fe-4S)-binding protein [Sulfitobacter sp. SK012]